MPFGIARARNNPSGYVAPELIRNEFGVSAGGPVRIPHLYNGRDKTFFFFAYERYSQASKPYQSVSVPTPQMLQGDFSGATNSSGILQVLYDPATTTNNPACAGGSNVACRQTFTQEYNEGPGSGPANCNGRHKLHSGQRGSSSDKDPECHDADCHGPERRA